MWPGDIEKREGEKDGTQAEREKKWGSKEGGEGWVDMRKGGRHDTDVPSPDVAY